MESESGLDLLQLQYPKAILFDWDNTIVDSMHCIHIALENTFKKMNKDFSKYDKERCLGRRDTLQKHFGEKWEVANEIFVNELKNFSVDDIVVFSDIEEVLKYIADSNIFLGIVSNKLSIGLHNELEHFGLKKYFQNIVGSGDAIRDKPYKDPVILVLENSGIAPASDVWLVGDSITDIECAINSNITPILYKSNYTKIEEKCIKINSHVEIISMLENIKNNMVNMVNNMKNIEGKGKNES